MYRLLFEIDDLPKMANHASGASTHWRYEHAERRKWQRLIWAAIANKKPRAPLQTARLTLTRFSSVAPDYDGLVRGFKAVVDGLVRAGVLVDDRLENTGNWNCLWERAARGRGKIRVQVEEVKQEGERE